MLILSSRREADAILNGVRGCVGVVDDEEMDEVVEAVAAGADQMDSDTSEQGEKKNGAEVLVSEPSSGSSGLNLDEEEKHDQLNK